MDRTLDAPVARPPMARGRTPASPGISQRRTPPRAAAAPAKEPEELVLEHRWLVHELARRHVARRWAHSDLVAAGYLGLVKASRSFREGDFVPYAATVVRREMLAFLKECGWPVRLPRNQRAPAPDWKRVGFQYVDAEAHVQPEEIPETVELAPVLLRALERLPEPWRQTMRLFYLEDYRISQLAHRFRITLEGVRARLRKGRDLVRDQLPTGT